MRFYCTDDTVDLDNKFKMEAASEVGVNLKQGYNGDLTSAQAGSIGGRILFDSAGV